MRKKCNEEFIELKQMLNEVHLLIKNLNTWMNNLSNNHRNIDKLQEAIVIQSNFLEQVITNTYEDDNGQFAAVALVPYRGKPILFKNGKRINSDTVTSFDLDWSNDGNLDITTRNE